MKDNTIGVWKSCHENGMVPKFFAQKLAQEKGEDPYGNKRRCERASNITMRLMISGLVCLILALPPAVLYGKDIIPMFYIFIPFGIGFVLFSIGICHKEPSSHYWDFRSSVEEFFQTFGIRPSKEIGAMSREEFITAIAGSLRTAAKEVDAKEGFERVAAMSEWKEGHAEALKWGLCKEGYETYFPKK